LRFRRLDVTLKAEAGWSDAMRMILATTAMIASAALGMPARAQTVAAPTAPAAISSPNPAEVATPEAIVETLYKVISGPAGPRDWPKLRGLTVPGASFIVAGARDGAAKVRMLSVEDYVATAGKAMATQGFYEHGVIGEVWRYAHIAAVTSPYASRHAPGDTPFARGINHVQLLYDGKRWWVVSIYWEGESAAFPLPPQADSMLKAK
jgi:hypothetical protein